MTIRYRLDNKTIAGTRWKQVASNAALDYSLFKSLWMNSCVRGDGSRLRTWRRNDSLRGCAESVEIVHYISKQVSKYIDTLRRKFNEK